MKRNYFTLILISLFAFVSQMEAQITPLKKAVSLNTASPMLKTAKKGSEQLYGVPLNQSVQLRFEEAIGSSWYDLQTNGAQKERLVRGTDGTMSAAWTMSQEQGGGFTDRGTGYNHFDGTEWGPLPNTKLEADDRTGWPAICRTANGTDVIINHVTSDSFRLHTLILPAGSTTWQEADIPSSNPYGQGWPNITAGGPDGNTLHAISLTDQSGGFNSPAGTLDQTYLGLDGNVLYHRSLDGGATWDIANMTLPGLDSLSYSSIGSDSYVIDASGNTVAIGILDAWGDIAIFKSTDNGNTWAKTIVNEFPFKFRDKAIAWNGHGNPDADGTYNMEDIYPDGVIDPESPNDTFAIRTSDGGGSILIDNDGTVHLWYGEMWVGADLLTFDPDAQANSFFPATSGLAYWNETMGENTQTIIADVVDANGNDTLDIATTEEIATYFKSLTSMANSAVDVNGDIYLTYSGVTENFLNTADNQFLRHVYLMKSTDNGATWSDPLDVVSPEFVADLFDFTEAIYPSLPTRNMDGAVNLMYMRDFKPGLSVAGDEDDPTLNQFVYIEINDGLISSDEDVIQTTLGIKVFPNPATNAANVQIELLENTDVNVTVIDISGKIIQNIDYSNLARGVHQKTLNTSNYQNGTYFIQVRTDDGIITKKLMVLN